MTKCQRRPLVLAIVGATATGKSTLALDLADKFNAEIVSVDSVQVYRGMDIGSDKPSKADRSRVPHHMIDIIGSDEDIDVEMFRSRAAEAILEITSRRRLPLLVGGSALYFTALTAPVKFRPTDVRLRSQIEATLEKQGLDCIVAELQRIDPTTAKRIDIKNARRVVRALESAVLMSAMTSNTELLTFSSKLSAAQARPPGSNGRPAAGPAALAESTTHDFPVNLVGLALVADPNEHSERIRNRIKSMFGRGFEDEVRSVFGIDTAATSEHTTSPSRTASQALGYKEVAAALTRGKPGASAIDEIVSRTRQLSRRQIAWFRKDPRLNWVSISRISLSGLFDTAHSYFETRLRATGKESSS